MFTDNENKLLHAPADAFPLLKAVQKSILQQSCGSCRHANVNVHTMLRVAVNKYKSDKNFIRLCQGLFPLPCRIAGVMVTP